MERWEVILSLYDFMPDLSHYVCKVCGRKYKTDTGVSRHIDNNHYSEINTIRDDSICVS